MVWMGSFFRFNCWDNPYHQQMYKMLPTPHLSDERLAYYSKMPGGLEGHLP
ncbi:hypothetical protein NC99_38210 [Sunxiuqinia dokdonensis]|uniref:Uncharacterized protein n=1 Tax=Sunxiuqinia dokdonensis TaxID=1409788 RepID=A0A0L8V4N2_9BACT|nr:hypothetical protein NC99_38210 [Sunxiuqinia dokdonensis]